MLFGAQNGAYRVTLQMNPGGPQLLMMLFVLAVVLLAIWILVRAIGTRSIRRLLAILAGIVILYAGGLIGVALATRADNLRPGDSKCFDEWCASMLGATSVPGQPAIAVRLRLADHGRQAQRSVLARAFIETGGQRVWPRNPEALQALVSPGQEMVITLIFGTIPTPQPMRFAVTEAVSGEPTPGIIVIGDESSPFHPISGWPLSLPTT